MARTAGRCPARHIGSSMAGFLLPDDTFLYSVFDAAGSDSGYLIYRARLALPRAACEIPEKFRFFPLDQLPYDDIPTMEIRGMLRRFVTESAGGRFGIYMDSHDGGRVAMVSAAQPHTTHAAFATLNLERT